MTPLSVVRSPESSGGRGRPSLLGTVLETPEKTRLVVVRQVFFEGENAGNTGGPRVEAWVAFSLPDLQPRLVRGTGRKGVPLEWALYETDGEVGFVRKEEFVGALRRALHEPGIGLEAAFGRDRFESDRPVCIHDRRVILPGDPRFPSDAAWSRPPLEKLLARRNVCPDHEVAVIDCLILNLAPRAGD